MTVILLHRATRYGFDCGHISKSAQSGWKWPLISRRKQSDLGTLCAVSQRKKYAFAFLCDLPLCFFLHSTYIELERRSQSIPRHWWQSIVVLESTRVWVYLFAHQALLPLLTLSSPHIFLWSFILGKYHTTSAPSKSCIFRAFSPFLKTGLRKMHD